MSSDSNSPGKNKDASQEPEYLTLINSGDMALAVQIDKLEVNSEEWRKLRARFSERAWAELLEIGETRIGRQQSS